MLADSESAILCDKCFIILKLEMKIKNFLTAFLLVATVSSANADEYPSRPITILSPTAPGGIVDTSLRMVLDRMTATLGQPLVVDYRAGGSGNIAYGMAAKSPPDGYKLLASYSAYHTANPALFSNLPWAISSFKPIGMIAVAPHVVVVHPSLPVHNLKELVEYARNHPGKISYASAGSGSIPHLGTEMFKQLTGTDMVHVPYKGSGPVIPDLLAGRTQLFIASPPSMIQHIKAGTLRAIAVAGSSRIALLPDVLTSVEQGFPEFKLDAWIGLFAPAATPDSIVNKLAGALASAVKDPEVLKRARDAGIEAKLYTPKQVEDTVRTETAKWARVIESANIKVD